MTNQDLRGIVIGLVGVVVTTITAVVFARADYFAGIVTAIVGLIVLGMVGAGTEPKDAP